MKSSWSGLIKVAQKKQLTSQLYCTGKNISLLRKVFHPGNYSLHNADNLFPGGAVSEKTMAT